MYRAFKLGRFIRPITAALSSPHPMAAPTSSSVLAVSAAVAASLLYTTTTQQPSLAATEHSPLHVDWKQVEELADKIFEEKEQAYKEYFVVSDLPKQAQQRRGDIQRRIRSIQNKICSHVEALEALHGGKQFHEDVWDRPAGGGGITRVIQDGQVFEKAGVNVSVVHGKLPPGAVQAMRADHSSLKNLDRPDGVPFFACGVSVVIHGHNPNVPTVHCNYRYFEVGDLNANGEPEAWWVAGGADLTPIYLFEEDAKHFHQVHKNVCDAADSSYYGRFKKWCDEYFFLKHRGEARGIGGIFFDDLYEGPDSKPKLLNFLKSCGGAFCEGYFPLATRHHEDAFTDEQKRWQQLRRGRYVEFNLIWDRGTKFGLVTPDARIESILMSLPLTSRWEYMHIPQEGSPEAKLVEVLKNPKDWA